MSERSKKKRESRGTGSGDGKAPNTQGDGGQVGDDRRRGVGDDAEGRPEERSKNPEEEGGPVVASREVDRGQTKDGSHPIQAVVLQHLIPRGARSPRGARG